MRGRAAPFFVAAIAILAMLIAPLSFGAIAPDVGLHAGVAVQVEHQVIVAPAPVIAPASTLLSSEPAILASYCHTTVQLGDTEHRARDVRRTRGYGKGERWATRHSIRT